MLRNIWCFGHIWKLQIIAEENNKTAAILPIFFHISWTPHVPWSKRSLPLGPRHWLKIGTPSIPGRLPARRVQRPRGAARKGAAPGRCGKMWENVGKCGKMWENVGKWDASPLDPWRANHFQKPFLDLKAGWVPSCRRRRGWHIGGSHGLQAKWGASHSTT